MRTHTRRRCGLRWIVRTALLLVACGAILRAAASADDRTFSRFVVAADHPLASEAGAEMLRRGGNVVDAAVATAIALSVVRPASSGFGGGGFMVIWNAERGEAVALDYRERAPLAARRDMFAGAADPATSADAPSRRGHLAVAVPGHLAGLSYALETYGTMDWKTVCEPALRLARNGFPADAQTVRVRRDMLREFEKHPEYRHRYAALYRLYLDSGRVLKVGDTVRSPLAPLLERIAAEGADAFYHGEVAEALVAEMKRGGGLITRDDLERMRVTVRRPLRGRFDGFDVVTMPPPSSGGIALLETLNILSAWEKRHDESRLQVSDRTTADSVHLVAEALKHAFADRARWLGDADYVPVPIRRLTSTAYAERLAARIDLERTFPPAHYGSTAGVNDGGTSHFSVLDAQGNAVACTETINLRFGSFVVEPRFGIVLNNQMDDFAAQPGKANAFGLVQSEANAIAPGKRPLSSMTPTILVKDGRAVHVLGASGGPRIISTAVQVTLNLTRFGMHPQDAVDAPRLHHQWLPNELVLEPPLFESIGEALRRKGHVVRQRTPLAAAQVASRTDQGLMGACDRHKHGRPAGE